MVRWRVMASIALVVVAAACGDDDDAGTTTTRGGASVVPVASTVHAAPATEPAATPTTSVVSAATSAPRDPATTAPVSPTSPAGEEPAGIAELATDAVDVREIGRSVLGRPITAVERGTPGGTRVLVIGVIHGDEDDGAAILARLATVPVPEGIDLWLVESMNPDGQAAGQRGNANGVDLNRNFPHEWGPIAEPGDGEYAGTGPASEPETRAIVEFVEELSPGLVLWYHQDLFRLSPGEGLEGAVKERYAEITGLPIERITGGTYTGVAATWARSATEAISFIVELGGSLTEREADTHAIAVLDVAQMVAVE